MICVTGMGGMGGMGGPPPPAPDPPSPEPEFALLDAAKDDMEDLSGVICDCFATAQRVILFSFVFNLFIFMSFYGRRRVTTQEGQSVLYEK